jgi:hypothetical protein
MSCNCKNPKKQSEEIKNKNNKVLNITLKLVLYFFAMGLASIIVIPVMTVLLFRLIVLNKTEIDITKNILKSFNSKNKKEDNYENDDKNNLDYAEVEHLDVDYFNEVEVLDTK